MGEQHANGWRVSRHRLVAGATVGVIANAMSGRIAAVASASVFPNAEKASMGLSIFSGRCAPSRHPAEDHPQVLIIAPATIHHP